MIEINRRRIVVDGSARILLSGEIHYFRVARQEWADRLDSLARAGCDTVASYIPWLCHELLDGTFDLDGRTRPELDLGAFIDMCAERGLTFLARPGPFVMAELKNEGLPFRLYTDHPEIHPVTWDGTRVTSRTVDYLAPAYLAEVRRWYAAVLPVLVPRLASNGGNIIAVQLDNEVGMISWVNNAPDLTDHLLDDLATWLKRQHSASALAARYPFDLDDAAARADGIRSPRDDYAPDLVADLGRYMRNRFARYVATLRAYAEDEGVAGVPYIVNIHGSGGGRGWDFPIGISQLMESYAGIPGMISGSDHYLGDLTTGNVADLYLLNAFMAAVHDADQPLTSVEFEAGDGDYGRTLGNLYDPSAADLKTRLSVAQGNRLINYYLFAGGINPRLEAPVGDGNDRIAFTGERHGTGAPVGAEGQLGLTYPRTAEVIHAVRAIGPKLATMDEEHDDVAMAFVPDYFMTESVPPKSTVVREIVDNLGQHRFGGPGQLMVRAMLLGGFRFGAVDLQAGTLNPDTTPVLALASARYLDATIQENLTTYLLGGGRLLLCGEVPAYDLQGRPCAVLRDVLGLTPRGLRAGDHRYFLSVAAAGWAAPRPEVAVSYAQLFTAATGETVLHEYGGGDGCGFEIPVGDGRAVVVTTSYPGNDVEFYRTALARLGSTPALTHDAGHPSLVVTSTANDDGERFVHALSLTGYDSEFGLAEHGQPLFGGHRFVLGGRRGLMLPLDLRLDGAQLAYATAEIAAMEGNSVTFAPRQPTLAAAFATDRKVSVDGPGEVRTEGGRQVVRVAAAAGASASAGAGAGARVTVQWT